MQIMLRLQILSLLLMLIIATHPAGTASPTHDLFSAPTSSSYSNALSQAVSHQSRPASKPFPKRQTDLVPTNEAVRLLQGWTAVIQTTDVYLPTGPAGTALEAFYDAFSKTCLVFGRLMVQKAPSDQLSTVSASYASC